MAITYIEYSLDYQSCSNFKTLYRVRLLTQLANCFFKVVGYVYHILFHTTTTNIHASDSSITKEQIKQFYDAITKYVNIIHLMMSLIDVMLFNDVILMVGKESWLEH